ncbi:MAG: hypothetical protein A2Y10_08295 [Planctomycetes bacterium GWF2_41_51]|nr:MAG: hypothetical protein A2Y10_08295 [Planctomycetes bacterium GWF2_41_51]HBG25850.1 rubrerythrin family protein [Phycisphaerales bacterium]
MTYSADNVLQIAMQMERLGQILYESLAHRSDNEQITALAAKLVEEEKKHLWTFQRMYYSLSIDRCGPKMTEEQLTTAAGKFYKLILPSIGEVRRIALSEDTSRVLAMAMQMESDSIAFYLTMTASPGDASVIRNIVEEEKKHLAALRKLIY